MVQTCGQMAEACGWVDETTLVGRTGEWVGWTHVCPGRCEVSKLGRQAGVGIRQVCDWCAWRWVGHVCRWPGHMGKQEGQGTEGCGVGRGGRQGNIGWVGCRQASWVGGLDGGMQTCPW